MFRYSKQVQGRDLSVQGRNACLQFWHSVQQYNNVGCTCEKDMNIKRYGYYRACTDTPIPLETKTVSTSCSVWTYVLYFDSNFSVGKTPFLRAWIWIRPESHFNDARTSVATLTYIYRPLSPYTTAINMAITSTFRRICKCRQRYIPLFVCSCGCS